ncbi:MAG: CpsB/CapC family capsule biosynthesis tyrosine phosphatase [Flavobacteriales bacterium]|nr:CpsB/CapC family capsule biosynthesis tyrosine phosphatase [Flavobacteriales bacterium]
MSVIKKLFSLSRKQELQPVDFSLVATDMHSHLIPAIDDGAVTMEDSLRLIKSMHAMGYRKFITTPHIFSGVHDNSPQTILPGLEKVRDEIRRQNLDIEIYAAAEYYLDEQFEELIKRNELLTFGNNYVLFEISFLAEPQSLGRAVFNMQLNGYRPILAHPERYEFWHTEFSKYESLYEKGVLLQLNTNCLTGHYGPAVKKMSERLIDAGLISLVGSDCHHDGHIQLMQQVRTNAHLHKLINSGKLINPLL